MYPHTPAKTKPNQPVKSNQIIENASRLLLRFVWFCTQFPHTTRTTRDAFRKSLWQLQVKRIDFLRADVTGE